MQESTQLNESNRRDLSRYNVDYTAFLKEFSFDKASRSEVAARIKNITPEGAGIESNTLLEEGKIIKLLINLPGWEKYKTEFYKESQTSNSSPLVTLAQIVWSYADLKANQKTANMGVKFIGIDKDHQKALNTYLTKLNKDVRS